MVLCDKRKFRRKQTDKTKAFEETLQRFTRDLLTEIDWKIHCKVNDHFN